MTSQERFFTDISLTPLQAHERNLPALNTPGSTEPQVIYLAQPAITVDLRAKTPLLDPIQASGERFPWTPEQVLQDFQATMRKIRSGIEFSLPTANRNISFVPQSDLLPKDPEKLKRLVERYGPNILKGTRGDCRLDENGVFQIRIADLRDDPNTSYERVLGTTAHEYGHTLGGYIEDPVFEEMKAEAFKIIFLRVYNDCDVYLQDGYDANSVHDIARNLIAQLTAKGIPEEAILAHLTNRKFGEFYPQDYKRLNGKGLLFKRKSIGLGNQGYFSLN